MVKSIAVGWALNLKRENLKEVVILRTDESLSTRVAKSDLAYKQNQSFAPLPSTTRQADWWLVLIGFKVGSICVQSRIFMGQRGWKRQPEGRWNGLGVSPCKMIRSRRRLGFGTGMTEMRALV
jgi:hypothetical protein